MYNKLILFKNELKFQSIYNYKIIGIIVELIFSKKIFKKNAEIQEFLENIFNYEAKDYILKSRSLIISKISKIIVTNDEKEKENLRKKIASFVDEKIEFIKKNESIKDKPNMFDGWLD